MASPSPSSASTSNRKAEPWSGRRSVAFIEKMRSNDAVTSVFAGMTERLGALTVTDLPPRYAPFLLTVVVIAAGLESVCSTTQ